MKKLIYWLFGKKSTMKEIKKDFVVQPPPKQNFRHITPYKSDSSNIYKETEKKYKEDDSLFTNLAITSMLIDNNSNNNSSSSYESNNVENKGFDEGFGGGGFSGGGTGSSWEDSSSSYDSGSSYDSSSSSNSDW